MHACVTKMSPTFYQPGSRINQHGFPYNYKALAECLNIFFTAPKLNEQKKLCWDMFYSHFSLDASVLSSVLCVSFTVDRAQAVSPNTHTHTHTQVNEDNVLLKTTKSFFPKKCIMADRMFSTDFGFKVSVQVQCCCVFFFPFLLFINYIFFHILSPKFECS